MIQSNNERVWWDPAQMTDVLLMEFTSVLWETVRIEYPNSIDI